MTGEVVKLPNEEQAEMLTRVLDLIHSKVPSQSPLAIYKKEWLELYRVEGIKGRLSYFQDDFLRTEEF